VKVGFLQLRPKFGEVKRNIGEAKSILKNVSEATIVLPELFNTGYLFRTMDELKDLAESVASGYTVSEMKKIAKSKKLNLIFGMAEKQNKKFYNTAVLITSRGKVFTYQKTHLFDREKLFFQPGNKAFAVQSIDGVKVGILICFDWIYPEAARVLALKGAQIIFHPSNLVLPFGQDGMRVRSIENRVFSITANRIGVEKRGNLSLSFTGKSQIIDPAGTVLASAGERSESLKIVEIDPAQACDKTIMPDNDLFLDRKTSLYRALLSKEKIPKAK
jgi:predicted amidohydrolase